MNSTNDHVGYQFPYAIKINPKITLWRQSFVKTMAAHKQPDSPAQNSKYSINVDNCTIDKLVMGDYNTVNDNRSGRSRPSSQESSPILAASRRLRRESGSTRLWTISHETIMRKLFLRNEITGHSNRRTDLTQFGASYRYCEICF